MDHSTKLAATFFFALVVLVELNDAARGHSLGQRRLPRHTMGAYNPEQDDGIPVFSAKSYPTQAASQDRWDSIDAQMQMRDSFADDADARLKKAAAAAQRRNSDSDLDDGLEDEDDDDAYQSGSSRHERVENPSYDESQKAARDGEEIESFFDKHLGPPQDAADSGDETVEVPIRELPLSAAALPQRTAHDDESDGDEFETAASSPLATIFQSLLHKRPLVITTASDEPADAVPAKSAQVATETAAASPAAAGSSNVEAVPVGYYTAAPVADGYEQQVAPAHVDSGAREIYIGRKPTVLKLLQQAQRPAQQASAAYPQTAGSANVWRGARPFAAVAPITNSYGGADYTRYPVAASYAQQYEQQLPQAVAASNGVAAANDDDEQTVSYGISFGSPAGDSAPAAVDEQAVDGGASANLVEQVDGGQDDGGGQQAAAAAAASPEEQQAAYVPYSARELTTPRYKMAHSMRNQLQNQAHQYYRQQPALSGGGGYVRVPHNQQALAYAAALRQQQQYYNGGGGARYHRDPSESVAAMQTSYAQPQSSRGTTATVERQHLLASLERQIKANPYYVSGSAETAAQSHKQQSRQRPDRHKQLAYQTVRKSFVDNKLDSYNAFRGELDPYRSFASTSQLVTEQDGPSAPSPSSQQPLPVAGANQPTGGVAQANAVADALSAHAQKSPTLTQQAADQIEISPKLQTGPIESVQDDLVRSSNDEATQKRVRRDDSDDRESDADDDDGVWVDDDEDDDGRQQSSDVNETTQEPEDEDSTQATDDTNQPIAQLNPPGVIGGPHGYELSPANDLMIYHGRRRRR